MQEKNLKLAGVEHSKFELCGLDLMFGFHYTDVVIFLDGGFDIARLEPSLFEVLKKIPVLGGRFSKSNEGIVLDTDGPGLQLTFVNSTQKALPFSESFSPITGYDLFNPGPNLANVPLSQWLLMTIRVTTFSDGVHSIGIRYSHAVLDGTSFFTFLMAWSTVLKGFPIGELQYSRQPLLDFAKLAAAVPSEQSGLQLASGQTEIESPQFFTTEFGVIKNSADTYHQLVNLVKEQFRDVISPNDLMHAMVFKAYALSSQEPDEELARANLAFDIRRVKGSNFPFSYFGNAVLLRTLKLSFGHCGKIVY